MKQQRKSGYNYFIGIDCGANNTEVLVLKKTNGTSSKQNASARLYKYQPVNYNVHGLNKSITRIEDIIKKVTAKLEPDTIKHITIGIAGARRPADRNVIKKAISGHLKFKNLSILADTEIAFASAFEPEQVNCGILIAGTGSILYFKNAKGAIERIGGWGRYLGDEGSGYWIARKALNRITKHHDKRNESSILARNIAKKHGLNKDNLIKKIYHDHFDISQVTKTVFRCAEAGDKDSIKIIKQAAEHLAGHLRPLKNTRAKIALLGSLFTEEKLLEKYFKKNVSRKFKRIKLIKTDNKPVWGAVKIAVMKAGNRTKKVDHR